MSDTVGCSTCRCSNPCEVHECPDGSRCAIDVMRTSAEGIRTEPVCRRVNKPGVCPSPNRSNAPDSSDCQTRCRDDADCRGEHKCCNNGCAMTCMPPSEGFVDLAPSQPEPANILPGPNTTEGVIGEPAELPCNAVGWPRPTVTWWRQTTMLPLSSRRYQQLPDYALLIRSVVQEDFGEYACHAHNGIGSGAVFKVTLVIDLSHGADTGVLDVGRGQMAPLPPPVVEHAPLSTHTTLATRNPLSGRPLQVDCVVSGGSESSPLRVRWVHGGDSMFETDRKRILSNHTLFITRAEVGDSGEYRCVAEEGGSVAQSSVVITVKEPPEDTSCVDNPSFNNCQLIVKAKYCNNKFYGKYCCASCMKAGQLVTQ